MNYISNCCGAPVYEDTDICTDCKEHCALEEVEEVEKIMGLSAEKTIVDKYWNKRVNKALDDKVNFKNIKPIKSII